MNDFLHEWKNVTYGVMSRDLPTVIEALEGSVERAEQNADRKMSEAELDYRWQELTDEQRAKGLCLYVHPETLVPCEERPIIPGAHYCDEHNLALCFESFMGRRR